jgi:glycosyltransferase involved in cell wall biosynthesis
MRIALTVVAYEASGAIEAVLDRIPASVAGSSPLVLVSDDASSDRTLEVVQGWAERHPEIELEVIRQPVNLGYGANQRALYRWAHERGADVAVLLHGDGQYPPEMCDELVRPLLDGAGGVVHGSRMLIPGGARRGRMPLGRRMGNRVLSRTFNLLSGAHLSEWFTGFRAYDLATVLRVGLDGLPDGFDFDIAITLRLLGHKERIAEVAIPTRYGEEISRVPLLRTASASLGHALAFRRRRVGQRDGADPAAPAVR